MPTRQCELGATCGGAAAAHCIPAHQLRLLLPGLDHAAAVNTIPNTPPCTLHPSPCTTYPTTLRLASHNPLHPARLPACRRVIPTPPSFTCWSGGRLTCTCSRRSGGRSAGCTHTSQAGKWRACVWGADGGHMGAILAAAKTDLCCAASHVSCFVVVCSLPCPVLDRSRPAPAPASQPSSHAAAALAS
jgi:hypothetical protein